MRSIDFTIGFVASMLRRAEPTPFRLEATLRRGLRVYFILNGARWQKADDASAAIIGAALQRVGARRPRWAEAQPEYTAEGIVPFRTTCAKCGARLTGNRRLFCSAACGRNYHHGLYRHEPERRLEVRRT